MPIEVLLSEDKDPIFKLCNFVRETSFAIHKYH